MKQRLQLHCGLDSTIHICSIFHTYQKSILTFEHRLSPAHVCDPGRAGAFLRSWKLVAFSVVLKAVTHLVSMSCSFLYIAATRNDIVNAQDKVLGYSIYKAMMRCHSEFPNLANVNVIQAI